MYCPNCGKEVRPTAKFCESCGTRLQGDGEPASHAASQSAAQPQDGLRQPAPAHQAATRPAPAAAPHKPKGSKTALVLGVVCAVLLIAVVLVAVSLFAPQGGSANTPGEDVPEAGATSASIANAGAVPSVTDAATGQTVSALERPSLVSALTQATEEPSQQASSPSYTIEPGLSNVINVNNNTVYLTDTMESLLQTYGFGVEASWGNTEFFEVYESNRYNKVPNFVTVDSLMHTYHLYYQHLQKNTEKGPLSGAILSMSKALLATSQEQLQALAGTEWEEAALRNVAFFAVGASLQDAGTVVPAEVADVVHAELASIQTAGGVATSALTGDQEDYSQYKPRGYYEGDPTLEAYFRTMMWYGRLNFAQKDEDLTRSALLATLALEGDALANWEAVYSVTSFFAGAADDLSYYEYLPLAEAAYGSGVTAADLPGNAEAWQHFLELAAAMPAPQINSVPLGEGDDAAVSRTEEEKGWRLMGQRFTLDEMIFTQLLTPEVGTNESGAQRTMPDALDVPAALGSDAALDIVSQRGATSYQGYSQNVESLRAELTNEADPRWSASLYSQWLYTLNPLLAPKGEGYPAFMQTDQWTRKSLQSYLGSYTELKHDSVLYAKQIMAEGGGAPLEEVDDRGYVEPEPAVFERLANLTAATRDGLESYGLISNEDASNLSLLEELANRLAAIASKELANQTVSDEEFELIRSYGEQLEHFWQEVYKDEATREYFTSQEFPSAIVVDVATDGASGSVLELGTGRALTMYVIVPVEGSLRIATGSVFSFYQFAQPMQDRLTDSEWRQQMGIEVGANGSYSQSPAHELEDWTQDFAMRSR